MIEVISRTILILWDSLFQIGTILHSYQVRLAWYRTSEIFNSVRFFDCWPVWKAQEYNQSLNWTHILPFTGDNQITSIPTEIGLLNNLRSLRLSKFKSFEIFVWSANSICFEQVLHCILFLCYEMCLSPLLSDNNQISSIPSEIAKLGNLKELYLGKSFCIDFLWS